MAFFAGNDWTNLPHEAAMPWLAEALEPGARFGPPGGPGLDAAAEAVTRGWWQQERPPLLEFFRRQKILRNFMALQKTAGVLGLHYPQEVQPQPLYREVLQRAAAVTAQWDGELVVVFVPMVDRFRGLFAHGFVHDRLRRIVAADAAAAGLRMIDLTADFEAGSRDGPLFALDSHFSPAGAELAAAVIAREIAREAQALPEPGRQAAARGETQ
jgi:hypothetical protein